MTLTDFIFDTLKEVVSEYNGKPSNRAVQNKSAYQSVAKKYSYSKKEGNNSAGNNKKRLISEQFVIAEISAGREVIVGEGDIVTPSARDILNRKNKY